MRYSQIPAIEKDPSSPASQGNLVVAYSKYNPTVAGFLAAGGDEDTCLILAFQPRRVVIE